MPMKINIIRGQNQIGGNIVEISTEKTKIILDVGLELDDEKNKSLPNIEGLFDYKGYDAIFISHYHGDHLGLAYSTHKDIAIETVTIYEVVLSAGYCGLDGVVCRKAVGGVIWVDDGAHRCIMHSARGGCEYSLALACFAHIQPLLDLARGVDDSYAVILTPHGLALGKLHAGVVRVYGYGECALRVDARCGIVS